VRKRPVRRSCGTSALSRKCGAPSTPTWFSCTADRRIAARWADHRKVPQIAFKPDWARHNKAAPFKRNDQILDVLPIGIIVFPGSGISANLADKAKKLGIPVWKFGGA
jgi:hypothetical protein